MLRKLKFESLLSPEVLYYNLVYHIRNEFEKQGLEKINTKVENIIEQIISQNVREIKWEQGTKE